MILDLGIALLIVGLALLFLKPGVAGAFLIIAVLLIVLGLIFGGPSRFRSRL